MAANDDERNTASEGSLARRACSSASWSGARYSGGALAPDGKVILAPLQLATIGIYDPNKNAIASGPSINENANKFGGAVAA